MSVQDTKERNGKKHVWQTKQCKNGVFSEMTKNRRRDYNKNNEHFQTRKFDMWNENKLFLYLQKPIVKEFWWKGGHKVVELTNMCWKMVSTHGVHTMVVYPDQYIPSHVPAYKCNCNTSWYVYTRHKRKIWEKAHVAKQGTITLLGKWTKNQWTMISCAHWEITGHMMFRNLPYIKVYPSIYLGLRWLALVHSSIGTSNGL